ncbi:Dual specificity protein phosphatase [Thermogladius calderae 1633]|uniref:Dual specificity protein phosphatase n=1 Tax=Thermogladius calderae (strain DSM 22663 / VKM B-2946 / 1633) TaxID=1184251 RepID=I3TEJ2_THEC1|nr:dual specificity protein phosphatase [Thermogladius calderae]AFK51180.1 Dual specificity protein phosphatase [Thermogladius calderae 1633]
MFKWIIPGLLAQSPRPSLSDVDIVKNAFTGVVNLLSKEERPEDLIMALASKGVEVYHAPTHDFHPVELVHVIGSIDFIERHRVRGGRVLVHCSGGVGRSSQVTGSYLIYRGQDLYTAVKTVRNIVSGAFEIPWQFRLLEDFSTLVELMGRESVISQYQALASELESKRLLHLSKAVQFVIELGNLIGMGKRELRNSIEDVIKGVRSGGVEHVTGIARLAVVLDQDMSGRVVVLDGEVEGGVLYLRLLCDLPCDDIASKVTGVSTELELSGVRGIHVETGLYMDYVF